MNAIKIGAALNAINKYAKQDRSERDNIYELKTLVIAQAKQLGIARCVCIHEQARESRYCEDPRCERGQMGFRCAGCSPDTTVVRHFVYYMPLYQIGEHTFHDDGSESIRHLGLPFGAFPHAKLNDNWRSPRVEISNESYQESLEICRQFAK